jgi:hypothetical protein
MWFRVKDLLIQLQPEYGQPGGRPDQNIHPAIDWSCFCTPAYSACWICTELVSCDGCTFCTPSAAVKAQANLSAENLGKLKAELQRQLAEVEEAEERQKQPKTVEDVAALEQRLTDALEEVRQLKAQLSEE